MSLTTHETTAAEAQLGSECSLGYKPLGATGAYTIIGTVDSIAAPKIAIGKVESKRLSNRRKTYRPLKPDMTTSFGVQHIPNDSAISDLRLKMQTAPVPVLDWQLKYENGVTDTFSGFPESYDASEVDEDGLMTAKVGIQIVSDVVTADAVAGP